MDMFYVRENTGRILNQKEYDNVPHHNPATDNYIVLGEFEDFWQARNAYEAYKKKKQQEEEKIKEKCKDRKMKLYEEFALKCYGLETFWLELPERQQNALNMYFREGKTYKQIGQKLQISKERVRQIIRASCRTVRLRVTTLIADEARMIRRRKFPEEFDKTLAIDTLELSTRANKSLKHYFGDKKVSREDIERLVFSEKWKEVRNMGVKTRDEIRKRLCMVTRTDLYKKYSIER